MIRKLKDLSVGQYIADYRYDEGIRIREEFICPTLTAKRGGYCTQSAVNRGC